MDEKKTVKKQKVEYPNRPLRSTGYTEEWILAYFEQEKGVTKRAISNYMKAIKDTQEKKERSKIFYQMFIEDHFITKIESLKKKKATRKED